MVTHYSVLTAAEKVVNQHSAMVYDAEGVPRFARVAVVFDNDVSPSRPIPPHPALTRNAKSVSKPLTMDKSLMIYRFYRGE